MYPNPWDLKSYTACENVSRMCIGVFVGVCVCVLYGMVAYLLITDCSELFGLAVENADLPQNNTCKVVDRVFSLPCIWFFAVGGFDGYVVVVNRKQTG